MALVAHDLKRVLAYSTVSQLGYMVYAVGAGGIFASQFHLLSHAVFKALLFLGAGAVIHAVGTRDMRQMGGLGRQMPFDPGALIVGALALAGMPDPERLLEQGTGAGGRARAADRRGRTSCMLVRRRPDGALHRSAWYDWCSTARRAVTGHAHDAAPAMQVALIPLAFGTLTTWLLAGPFSQFLGDRALARAQREAWTTPGDGA